MAQKVKIDGLAEAVMKELTEYADLATVDMKSAVKKAGNTVKKQIQGYRRLQQELVCKEHKGNLQIAGGHGLFQKSLSVSSPSRIWSRQAWRWSCSRSFPHCSRRGSWYQRTGI